MQIGTQEHYDIISSFEKYIAGGFFLLRMDKEEKSEWQKGRIYQSGETNNMFKLYSAGYSNARCVYLQGGPNP